MKTSKPVASSKSGKNSGAGKTVKGKKVTETRKLPTEEEIREKAMEIYHRRIESGVHGTAEQDWMEAEKYFRTS
jgi:hypothetical protein